MIRCLRVSEDKFSGVGPPESTIFSKEGGKGHKILFARPRCSKLVREAGRLWMGAVVNVIKYLSEPGRIPRECWNELPIFRNCNPGGRLGRGWLNEYPSVKCVRDDGSEGRGLLNDITNLR